MSKQRSLDRWYKLIDHPVQLELINDDTRFKVVPAGRRSGKTERFKRFVVKQAMKNPGKSFFVGAPTINQVKRIYWNDLKLLSFSSIFERKPSETELTIYFPNNSTISLIGFDQPQRFEGQVWHGGGIDEIADIKETAWAENISPALDTINPKDPDYRAWCWLIGVPDGLNHYYEMAEYARVSSDPDWKLYTWKSSDILPADMIESAKRRMSAKQFRQEYEASFETAQGRVYEDYSNDNYSNAQLDDSEVILWMHDFNYTPMSSAIGVRRQDCLYLVDEIVLESAVARQSALEFVERFKDHKNKHVIIYGDPAGKAGEKHGHASDYTEIEQVLRENKWEVQRKVKAAAPAIKDRQNAVRAKIRNAANEVSLFVNPQKCVYTHKGLNTVQIKEGSTFLEVDSSYQHITTAIGYCVDYEWPITMKKQVKFKPMSQRNFW
jgi:hypothetical protein